MMRDMRKRELVKEDIAELAYSVIWREFSDYYANAQCDCLAEQLGSKLLLVLEEFVDVEHERRERLLQESLREKELEVYG